MRLARNAVAGLLIGAILGFAVALLRRPADERVDERTGDQHPASIDLDRRARSSRGYTHAGKGRSN